MSRGSIRFSMLAMTEKPRSNPDFRVETNSSETPPPSTPDMRHLTAGDELVAKRRRRKEGSRGRTRRWREIGGGGWQGLRERSVRRDRMKARAVAAMNCKKLQRVSFLFLLQALRLSVYYRVMILPLWLVPAGIFILPFHFCLLS